MYKVIKHFVSDAGAVIIAAVIAAAMLSIGVDAYHVWAVQVVPDGTATHAADGIVSVEELASRCRPHLIRAKPLR